MTDEEIEVALFHAIDSVFEAGDDRSPLYGMRFVEKLARITKRFEDRSDDRIEDYERYD